MKSSDKQIGDISSGWYAWKNVIPGTGTKQTFYLTGSVLVLNSCAFPELVPDKTAPDGTLFYRVIVKRQGHFCGQVCLQKHVETSYAAKVIPQTIVVVHFQDGSKIELPINIIE
jgi:hypothetical protein